MNNHWLNEAKYKRLFDEIDDLAMQISSEDGTMADFINAMSSEQSMLFLSMMVKDIEVDRDVFELRINAIRP